MSGYIGNIPVPQSTQVRETFIATASQTSFATAGYTPGFIDVYLNGVKLINGTDFTASNGSDVVLTTGATVSDTVEVVAYGTFETNSQTFTGVTTISELSDGTDTVETGYVVNGSAKVWVQYLQSTPVVSDSFNVSSVSDDLTGRFTVNYTSALSSDAHARSLMGNNGTFCGLVARSTTNTQFETQNDAGTAVDTGNYGSFHGDLA